MRTKDTSEPALPEGILRNAFTENLGDDFLALDNAGNVLARAATSEEILKAAPNASVYIGGPQHLTPAALGNPLIPDPTKQPPPPTADPVGFAPKSLDADIAEAEDTTSHQAPATGGEAFDHDGDGKVGGSKKRKTAKS